MGHSFIVYFHPFLILYQLQFQFQEYKFKKTYVLCLDLGFEPGAAVYVAACSCLNGTPFLLPIVTVIIIGPFSTKGHLRMSNFKRKLWQPFAYLDILCETILVLWLKQSHLIMLERVGFTGRTVTSLEL